MADQSKRVTTTNSKAKATTVSRPSTQVARNDSRALVPRNSGATVARQSNQPGQVMLAPKGYTMRAVQPAKNYDVVSFARAMNDDFGSRVKELFDPEREAALAAQETGVYIGWRCPEYNWDCQRVGRNSRCFCGHILGEHSEYNGRSVRVPCRAPGCACKAFAWVPSRPEDVGEFWLPKRRDFDRAAWRANCRCKHTHEEHDPNGQHRCRRCGCGQFSSSSVCAACDRHWEAHETCFDTAQTRQEKKLPVGADYLPFAEIPSLRNMVLTGEDDGDMSYMRLQERTLGQGALPPSQSHRDSDAVVPYRDPGRGRRGADGFPDDRRRYNEAVSSRTSGGVGNSYSHQSGGYGGGVAEFEDDGGRYAGPADDRSTGRRAAGGRPSGGGRDAPIGDWENRSSPPRRQDASYRNGDKSSFRGVYD